MFVDVTVHGGSGVFSYQIQNTSVARIASDHEGKAVSTIKVSSNSSICNMALIRLRSILWLKAMLKYLKMISILFV